MSRRRIKKTTRIRSKIKELSPSESIKKVKELLKEKKKMHRSDLYPGNLIFTSYNAKYKEFTFDRTPLFLILKKNNKHTLGLNFHWIPLSMRINLIKHILLLNKTNIEQNKPIKFSYEELRPMLKSFGYAPVIRKYINARIGKSGVVIPPERLMEVARLKTETFTNGMYSASQLLAMARKKVRKRK